MPFPAHVQRQQKPAARPEEIWIQENLASLRLEHPQEWVAASSDGLLAASKDVARLISSLPEHLRNDPKVPYAIQFIDS